VFSSVWSSEDLTSLYSDLDLRNVTRLVLWPDLRLKWPQVDYRRLDHIHAWFDLTWLRACRLESTWNNFKSLEVVTFFSSAGFATAALFSGLSLLVLLMGQFIVLVVLLLMQDVTNCSIRSNSPKAAYDRTAKCKMSSRLIRLEKSTWNDL